MPQFPAISDLIQLTLDAGREVMAVHDAGFEAIKKEDGSPVTIADQRAEAVIEAGLQRLAPGVPMLGEESTSEGRIPELGDLFWCVDPIDGTKDFIEGGTGEFTVNIALVENGVPIIGIVLAPATGALYAGSEAGAFYAQADARSAKLISELKPIRTQSASVWRIIGSRRHGKGGGMDKFCEAIGAHERIAASSSIKFCKLAEGAADLYPRFGPVSEWDAAAGHAVLIAAGGGVMLTDGGPMMYGNVKSKFLIDGFVAYSRSEAREAALAALAQMKANKR
ncbi:MAG: 3'(2'),5'-bisphosphate nucleotidase CysQ [Caulobacterales bacterium]